MLRSLKEVLGYTIMATNDTLGSVSDFYFDDKLWTIRYLVIDTGTWLPGRQVLVSPHALSQPDWETRLFPVLLTREQIENSPSIEMDKPVSRQDEIALQEYYEWPTYWPTEEAPAAKAVTIQKEGDPHLRSTAEVVGYNIQARDGEIGHLEDFIVEDDNWIVQYMVVDTRNWLPGKKVIVAPDWTTAIDAEGSNVYVDLTKETIENSPPYDPSVPVNREYEERLYDYYGRPRYWTKA